LARRREAPVKSEEEKNKELARRFMEARIKGDLDATDEMLAPTSSTIIDCFPAKNPIARITCGGSLLIRPPSPNGA
jgi:ketosteroid isomerase-like protein